MSKTHIIFETSYLDYSSSPNFSKRDFKKNENTLPQKHGFGRILHVLNVGHNFTIGVFLLFGRLASGSHLVKEIWSKLVFFKLLNGRFLQFILKYCEVVIKIELTHHQGM